MRKTPVPASLIAKLVDDIIGEALHSKQVDSVVHSTLGALHADRAGVAAIGRSAARQRGTRDKHAIKQFDRYLSNEKIKPDVVFDDWVPVAVGPRKEVVVAIDWTEYALDGHSTITISMVTRHGRATPLIWLTVYNNRLKNRRSSYEDRALTMLAKAMPAGVRVTVLGDRGFGDQELYEMLAESLKFDFVIRFRGCILVTSANGDQRPAHDWLRANGKPRRLLDVRLTHKKKAVAAVVTVRAPRMKEAWYLATSRSDDPETIIALYARRFQIEETFRDQKDRRFGLGLYATRIGDVGRRDRMLLVLVLALFIATLLGSAGEQLGLDRYLRANTAKKRTHSLFRQGREYIAGVSKDVLASLQSLFLKLVRDHSITMDIYAEI